MLCEFELSVGYKSAQGHMLYMAPLCIWSHVLYYAHVTWPFSVFLGWTRGVVAVRGFGGVAENIVVVSLLLLSDSIRVYKFQLFLLNTHGHGLSDIVTS